MAEAADWERHLAQIGTAGGMAAKTVSPEQMAEQFHRDLAELDDTPLPDDMNIHYQAQKDYRGMVKALSKTGKRKTFPEWGVPAEALHMAMAPGRAKKEREIFE